MPPPAYEHRSLETLAGLSTDAGLLFDLQNLRPGWPGILQSGKALMRTPVLSSYAKGVAYILLGAVIMSFGPLFVPLDGVGSTAIAMHRLFWGGLALLGKR